MPVKRSQPKSKNAKRPDAQALPPLESPADVEMAVYTTRDIKRRVALPAELIRSMRQAGQLHPVRSNGKVTYSFQDLLVMRAASALVAAKIPSRKIVDALNRIREALPPGASLNPAPVVPAGEDASPRDRSTTSESLSEQQLLPLTVDHRPSSVAALKRRSAAERRRAA